MLFFLFILFFFPFFLFFFLFEIIFFQSLARDALLDDDTGDGDISDDEEDLLLTDLLERDNTWTSLVLEVVGLMCDGQHRTLQDYLRDQPDNFKVS